MILNPTTRRYAWPVIAALLIVLLSWSIVRFRHNLPYSVDKGLVGNPEIVFSLEDVEVVGRDHGAKIWSFRANQADVARGRSRATLLDIKDGKLYDNGKVVATVKAGKVSYDPVAGNVEVTGGVEVTSAKRYRVTTDRATWTAFVNQLKCPGKVTFRANDSSLVGRNLVLDAKQRRATMEKARMTVTLDVAAEAVDDKGNKQ